MQPWDPTGLRHKSAVRGFLYDAVTPQNNIWTQIRWTTWQIPVSIQGEFHVRFLSAVFNFHNAQPAILINQVYHGLWDICQSRKIRGFKGITEGYTAPFYTILFKSMCTPKHYLWAVLWARKDKERTWTRNTLIRRRLWSCTRHREQCTVFYLLKESNQTLQQTLIGSWLRLV